MPGYCESVGGWFGTGDFRSNLDRQLCAELAGIRSEYELVVEREAVRGLSSGQVAVSARAILQTVDAIDDQLEAGETCLTLGRADAPDISVGFGLFGFAYRIIHQTWAYPQGTDIVYERLCTDWANTLTQLDGDLKQQLEWAGDMGRAETIGSLTDTAVNIGLTAANVTDVSPKTWCENAPEVCAFLKAVGWLLVGYVGFQAYKEVR